MSVRVCKHSTHMQIKSPFYSNPQKCELFESSDARLRNNRVGNDSISSALIFLKSNDNSTHSNGACKPKLNQEAVAVYQHPNYKGSCRLLSIGTYNNSKEMRFKNDSISSIEFGKSSKVEIVVYQHAKRKGRNMVLRKTMADLKESMIGDNAVSSVIVRRKR